VVKAQSNKPSTRVYTAINICIWKPGATGPYFSGLREISLWIS
jgi:hypothetical protein